MDALITANDASCVHLCNWCDQRSDDSYTDAFGPDESALGMPYPPYSGSYGEYTRLHLSLDSLILIIVVGALFLVNGRFTTDRAPMCLSGGE